MPINIILPSGGYRKLRVYSKSDIIYQGTVAFCRRFLPRSGDRTVDQMTQAARSCKQNIAEGSSASATSKETEIKLTNVARATLDELLEDYGDWLKAHGETEWAMNDPRKIAAKRLCCEKADWKDFKVLFETRPPTTLANLMIIEIHQTKAMLKGLLLAQEADFKRHGGVRERMHAARSEARSENWSAALYSRLDSASTSSELAERLVSVKDEAERDAMSIARRKGWRWP